MHVPSQPLDAITAFAVPNPNGHLAAPSVFSGLAAPVGRPGEPITQRTSGWLRLVARPFLPSTKVILSEDRKLSTPKVGANATYFCVRIFSAKLQKRKGASSADAKCPKPIHIFFTENIAHSGIASCESALESAGCLNSTVELHRGSGFTYSPFFFAAHRVFPLYS
jgi:hypothetical protein